MSKCWFPFCVQKKWWFRLKNVINSGYFVLISVYFISLSTFKNLVFTHSFILVFRECMDPVCTPNNGHAQSCFLRGESSALLLPSSFFQTPVVVSAHMQNLCFLPFFLCWINIFSRPIGKTSLPQLSHYFSLLLCEQNIYWLSLKVTHKGWL